MNISEATSLVRLIFKSKIAEENREAEGIVARSHPLMLFRNSNPIMWKLKIKDYGGIKK